MFQSTVYRQFPTGFPGDIVRDGPKRAKPGRIASDNVGTTRNVFSRAFGFLEDVSDIGTGATKTLAAFNYEVTVGGANFYGLLGHPKHHVLYGSAAGALTASNELPMGSEAEFFDMVTGMLVEIFNFNAATADIGYGWQLAYVTSTATAEQNANGVPVGGLIAVQPGTEAPAGTVLIPNSLVTHPVSMAASSPTALVSTYTIVQLTQ